MIDNSNKTVYILGIRGVPAKHGGFETFAENLAIYLANNDWNVTVYCQELADDKTEIYRTDWSGVQLIHIPVKGDDAKATVIFDYLSVQHAKDKPGLILTLGYNTALFNLFFRLKKKYNLINMDGIEWKRDKWRWFEKAWFYINERAGCLIGHHLIADHPEIKNHLATRVSENKVTVIPYGARSVTKADKSLLEQFDIQPNNYALIIARPEPENSLLEIITAYSSKPRGKPLVVLGKYDQAHPYQGSVLDVASDEVNFVGAIYDHDVLDALRYYSSLYIHGHTVGGTNPSLIEALGAGQPVLAHDNKFNRWVASEGAAYFKNQEECARQLDRLLDDPVTLQGMSEFSYHRYEESFTWDNILRQYEELLKKWI